MKGFTMKSSSRTKVVSASRCNMQAFDPTVCGLTNLVLDGYLDTDTPAYFDPDEDADNLDNPDYFEPTGNMDADNTDAPGYIEPASNTHASAGADMFYDDLGDDEDFADDVEVRMAASAVVSVLCCAGRDTWTWMTNHRA